MCTTVPAEGNFSVEVPPTTTTLPEPPGAQRPHNPQGGAVTTPLTSIVIDVIPDPGYNRTKTGHGKEVEVGIVGPADKELDSDKGS